MKYLLDTDICVFIIRKHPQSVFSKLRQQAFGEVGISSITHSELLYGAYKSQSPKRNLAALEQFLIPLEIMSYSSEVSFYYGKVRTALEKRGQPIGPLDTMIAAHALSLNLTLITNNTREFSRVENLHLQNWL